MLIFCYNTGKENDNTEVRGRLLALNYNSLKTARRKKLKFGENAF